MGKNKEAHNVHAHAKAKANAPTNVHAHAADLGCVAAFVLPDDGHGADASVDSAGGSDGHFQHKDDRGTATATAMAGARTRTGCMCGHIQIRPITTSLANTCSVYSQSAPHDQRQTCNGSSSASKSKSSVSEQETGACTTSAHAKVAGNSNGSSGQTSNRQQQQLEAPAETCTDQEWSLESTCTVRGYETVVAGICMVERRNVSPRVLDGDHTYWVQDVSKTCEAMGMRQPHHHSPTWTQGWFRPFLN
jgi:hypothetical protein